MNRLMSRILAGIVMTLCVMAVLPSCSSTKHVPEGKLLLDKVGINISDPHSAVGYYGVYDGNSHAASATASVSEGTVIEYSTDGGATWSTEPPAILDVGSMTVTVTVE